MRVLVTGDRNWKDRGLIFSTLDYLNEINGIDFIVEGCATGADFFAEQWAHERLLPEQLKHFPADWEHKLEAHCEWDMPEGNYCRREGPLRNSRMLVNGHPDYVVAFHDKLWASKGTGDMVKKAEKAGLHVYKISHPASGIETLDGSNT